MNNKRPWWHRALVWLGLRKADPVLVSDMILLPDAARFTPLNADGTPSWAAPTELFYQTFEINETPITKECHNVPCPEPEITKFKIGEVLLPNPVEWPTWPQEENDNGTAKPE